MKPTRFKGSNIVTRQIEAPVAIGNWTKEQVDLVRRTVAKDASPDELALFLTICNRRQLDPFSNQIYFSKIGGKLTIMESIGGVRLIAQRTGLWDGTRRGVLRDESGSITYGWCEVWIKGCSHSVYEEVPFKEFAQKHGQWPSKPETMIKKVAEMSALRIAFPQELSSAYIPEEMGVEVEEMQKNAEDIEDRFKAPKVSPSESVATDVDETLPEEKVEK